MARPSERTTEVEERIINGLMDGVSLVRVCEAEDMPNRRTVLRWMEADEGFATRCARARTMQADLMDDKIIDEAEACTVENANAARVRIAAYQWRASKLAPKKYGDKLAVGGDAEAGPVRVVVERRIVDPVTRPD